MSHILDSAQALMLEASETTDEFERRQLYAFAEEMCNAAGAVFMHASMHDFIAQRSKDGKIAVARRVLASYRASFADAFVQCLRQDLRYLR